MRHLWANHDDAKYVFHQQRYLKEFAIKFRDHCIFVSADDKAVIPVGEPEHAVSTGVKAHCPSLGPANPETVIGALDHDWNIVGIVHSMNLFVDIPKAAEESFFSGKAEVTLKDRIFQKSSSSRHGTKLFDQIWDVKPILLLVTDGGNDHNVCHASVQASLVAMFLNLELNFLFAMRTCATQSWTNAAERIMAILNIALQNVALERDAMATEFEKII